MGCRPILLALLLLALVPGVAAANPATQIIVKRDPGLTAAERADIRADAQVRLVESLPLRAHRGRRRPAPATSRDALRDLNADPDVVYAELNHRRPARSASDDDEAFDVQWGLQNVAQLLFDDELAAAASTTPTWTCPRPGTRAHGRRRSPSRSSTPGIDADHEDLDRRRIAEAATSSTASRTTPTATATARTSRARSPRRATTASASPAWRPTPGSAGRCARSTTTGCGTDSDIAEAFDWAGDAGYRVVNASLGGDDARR